MVINNESHIMKQPQLRLHLWGYNFTPKIFHILITLLLLTLLLSLGNWQLNRAAYKRTLLAEYQNRIKGAPLHLSDLNQKQKNINFLPILVNGHFDNAHQFLLDNKIYQHQVGYQVLTPLVINQSHKIILINRGWIPAGESRHQLPVISAINGIQTIRGIIYLPPTHSFTLSNQQENLSQWPNVIQTIHVLQIEKLLNHPIYPYIILLAPQASHGFIRDWQPVTISPYKHIGYAVQWFALAGTLIIIFFVVNIKGRR